MTEDFEKSIDLSMKILKDDPMNLDALRTLSDVLWKKNRFGEAISYAQKAIDLINNRLQELGVNESYMDADYYLKTLRETVDKCQRSEKWKWAR